MAKITEATREAGVIRFGYSDGTITVTGVIKYMQITDLHQRNIIFVVLGKFSNHR